MKTDLKVFIVEDDPIYSSILENNLQEQADLMVETFNSGEQFMDYLYMNPDVVMLDYHLDKMNGIDVLKEIRAFNPNIAVVFLSAQKKTEVAISSLKYGAFDYIIKNDESVSKLLEIIKKIKLVKSQVVKVKKRNKMKHLSLAILFLASIISTLLITL